MFHKCLFTMFFIIFSVFKYIKIVVTNIFTKIYNICYEYIRKCLIDTHEKKIYTTKSTQI